MQNKTVFLLVAGLMAAVPTVARAQDPVKVSFGGGYTAPNSEVRDHLGDGYTQFRGPGEHDPRHRDRGLYSFNGLGQKRISIPVSGTPGVNARSPPISSAT